MTIPDRLSPPAAAILRAFHHPGGIVKLFDVMAAVNCPPGATAELVAETVDASLRVFAAEMASTLLPATAAAVVAAFPEVARD